MTKYPSVSLGRSAGVTLGIFMHFTIPYIVK